MKIIEIHKNLYNGKHIKNTPTSSRSVSHRSKYWPCATRTVQGEGTWTVDFECFSPGSKALSLMEMDTGGPFLPSA